MRIHAFIATLVLVAPTLAIAPVGSSAAPGYGWDRFVYEAEGAAGDWVVVRVPFEREMNEIEYIMRFTVTAREPHDHGDAQLLVVVPTPIWDDQAGAMGGLLPPRGLFTYPRTEVIVQPDEASVDYWWWVGASSGLYYAKEMVFAIASPGPWTARVELRVGDGDVEAPLQVARGSGTRTWVADAAPVPGVGPTVLLTADLPAPGWTHFELLQTRLQPTSARSVLIRHPNNVVHGPASASYGYAMTDSNGWSSCQASSSLESDIYGTTEDAAGTYVAELTLVEAGLDRRGVLFSMEGAHTAWPDGMWPYTGLSGACDVESPV